MDNVLVAFDTEEEPIKYIRQVFMRFRQRRMELKIDKCNFLRKKSTFQYNL